MQKSLSSAAGQELAELTVKTLQGMRSDQSFTQFFALVKKSSEQTDTGDPVLPRKRRAPSQYEIGSGEVFHSTTVEEHYRHQYFEALDLAISTIRQCFNQPGYTVYKNLEALLVKDANNEDNSSHFKQVTSFYHDDIKPSDLNVQLQNLSTHFSRKDQGTVTLRDCLDYFQSLSAEQRSFYSEVCRVATLILVMPATNAISERCFSTIQVKTYLRSTMTQARLNHLMLLNINKERLDSLDWDVIANEFVEGSEHRHRVFGKFY